MNNYTLDASEMFTLLFVMIGPLGLLAPFAKSTQSLSLRQLRTLSLKSILLAGASVLIGGFLGQSLMDKWLVSAPVLLLAGGLIFLLVALSSILKQYGEAKLDVPVIPTPVNVAFPMIVTPYGMAAVIVFMATSHDIYRTATVLGLLFALLLLDLLTMIYVRPILKVISPIVLRVLSTALSVLQTALALQIMIAALRVIE